MGPGEGGDRLSEATLSLARTDPAFMKPGQKVRAVVRLEEAEGVIAIPRGAVFEKDGKREIQGVTLEGTENDIYLPVTAAERRFGRAPLKVPLDELVVSMAPGAPVQESAASLDFGAAQVRKLRPVHHRTSEV